MAPPKLRLTPAMVHILLTLVPAPQHGYAVMREIEDRTSDRIRLGPSSLYWALGRLEDAGCIREVGEPADADSHDQRRRYWQLTAVGRQQLQQEIEALSEIVSHANARKLESAR
jgi:DNA-binding PadR family transcriptional regulator